MVAKRWYDYPREDFDFVKKLQEIGAKKERISLTYESDFDDKGKISFHTSRRIDLCLRCDLVAWNERKEQFGVG